MITAGIYRHYKGKDYEVIGIGKNEATLEDVVIYKALYDGGSIWVRTLKVFEENVEVNGGIVPRFQLIKAKVD